MDPDETSATPTREDTISIVSYPEEYKYVYKYSFESAASFLDEEKSSMTDEPRNFNKKYGMPTVDELNSFTSSADAFYHWIKSEHPEILKSPTKCPTCGSELKKNGRNLRCYICAHHKKNEFK